MEMLIVKLYISIPETLLQSTYFLYGINLFYHSTIFLIFSGKYGVGRKINA